MKKKREGAREREKKETSNNRNKKEKRTRERERGREKAEEKSVNPGYRARLPRRLGSTSHWHSNFRPDRNLFPSGPFFFLFSSLFFYSSPRWRPSPPTKPPANPLWCTANIRRLSLVSPPQFVFSLATPFDQYFNFAMLRYLAGPKRTGRAGMLVKEASSSHVVALGCWISMDLVEIYGEDRRRPFPFFFFFFNIFRFTTRWWVIRDSR